MEDFKAYCCEDHIYVDSARYEGYCSEDKKHIYYINVQEQTDSMPDSNYANLSPFTKFQDEKVINMSASSIAQACGTSKLKVLDILKDIFLKIIDLAKLGEQMNLDVKIGNIVVEKDNRLRFENKPQSDVLNTTIDVKQGVQAQGGYTNIERRSNGPKSICSDMSFMTNVRSVNTPMTDAKSQASSKARSTQWSFFKGKNNANYDTESRVSNSKSIRSEKRRLIGGSDARREGLNNSSAIPYPHLASFIQRHTEYRYGKKMVIDNKPSTKEVMEEQLRQAQDKQRREVDEKLKRKEEELRGYFTTKNDYERDLKEREIDLINKRRDFMKAIDEMKLQKDMKTRLDKENSNGYHYNYFPYTHGDNIEKRQKDIGDEQFADPYSGNRLINDANGGINTDGNRQFRKKKALFLSDHLSNKSSIAGCVLNSRQDAVRYANEMKQRSQSSSQKGEYENKNDNVFFKPHKQHLHRFISDEQREDNYLKALKRHEDQLMNDKKKNEEFEAHLKNQIKKNLDDLSEEKNKKLK